MTEPQTLSFSTETSKILQLVIHSLYTNKDIFLRELISNASDACDKLRYGVLTQPELAQGSDFSPRITLATDKKARTLSIRDNGIGMNREDLIAHLGTIAKSGTQEFLSQIEQGKERDVSLIGQFGVGFYSAFMVADTVRVISRRAGTQEAHCWESAGQGEFNVRPATDAEAAAAGVAQHGTAITLHLRASEDGYLDRFRLQHIVRTYSDHIPFPILLETEEEKEAEQINKASCLWMRPKSEVSDEQYREFYRHVSHSPDEPWMTLHHRAEGKIEYTSLLFIPSRPPFDLFHPDRRRRVKLYVKRVFITEEGIDLVPHYLRFLQGVVDSEDLPLNISRETLQHNPVLERINESLAKKILSELKKKAAKEPEAYAAFWKHFGPVLKEGLCESIAPKEQLLETCRFYSSRSPDALISLEEYAARMKPGQEAIYYLTGDRVETLLASPQLEGFLAAGVEVLLLTDHVDDFWVNAVPGYKDKEFISATRADIDLRRFAEGGANGDDDGGKKDAPEDKAADEAEPRTQQFIAFLKTIFGDAVQDVRISHKLTHSPVCLAVGAGGMDFRMERFLMEHKQLGGRGAKVLEINPSHPTLQALMKRWEREGDAAGIADAAHLLLDQARILEGEEISDPKAFSARLNAFLQRGLAA